MGEYQIQMHTPAEVALCASVATQRLASKFDQSDLKFKSVGPSRFGCHFIGTLAELAACKRYGGKLNQKILPNGDGHAPDIVINGVEYEVKGITWDGPNPQIKIRPGELVDRRMYVLVKLKWPDTCWVYPAIPGSFISSLNKSQDYGDGPRHFADEKDILGYS